MAYPLEQEHSFLLLEFQWSIITGSWPSQNVGKRLHGPRAGHLYDWVCVTEAWMLKDVLDSHLESDRPRTEDNGPLLERIRPITSPWRQTRPLDCPQDPRRLTILLEQVMERSTQAVTNTTPATPQTKDLAAFAWETS